MPLAFPILYITFKFLISFYNFAKLYFPCTFASLNRKIEFDIYISTHTEDDKKSGKCLKKNAFREQSPSLCKFTR